MENLNSEQASVLAQNYLSLAKVLNDFRFDNWTSLSDSNKDQLEKMSKTLLDQGQDMLAQSSLLVLNDIDQDLKLILEVTNNMQSTLTKIDKINKSILLVGCLLNLGSAVISRDLNNIPDRLKQLYDSYKLTFLRSNCL